MNDELTGSRQRGAAAASPIILASASPRRRELLEMIGLPFEVVPAGIEERPNNGELPADFARRAARDKALDVAARHPGRCVLGADTVVEIDGKILGKPEGGEGALKMLRALSGRDHLVHTGVALAYGDSTHQIVDTARVRFFDLDDSLISWYVASGEPQDKAGAYAIQGKGGLLVAEMQGAPQTVIGLPLQRLPALFAERRLDFWRLLSPAEI